MQNKVYPLHCKCRIYNTGNQKAGNICIHCGSRMVPGLPSMVQIQKQIDEDKAIDRIMVT